MNLSKWSLLLLLCLCSYACSKEDPSGSDNLGKEEQTDFEVKNGMDLVGIVKDATTQAPIKGVTVSDGYSCTTTDENGIYQLARNSKAVFIYYSIPSDYEVPAINGIPKFYQKIDLKKTVFRKDFSLVPLNEKEDDFTLFCIADPQCKTDAHIARFMEETAVDLRRKAASSTHPYGITLGDIVWDTPDKFSSMKMALNVEGLKIFQVIGNHDHFQYGSNELACRENFEATFGPVDYSFNRGKVHIVAMDNVIYNAQQDYDGGFTNEQIQWLKEDLSYVPKDFMVILCVHIPFRNSSSMRNNKALNDLLSQFAEAHIMSGHTHYNQNVITSSPSIYEHVHGAACGNWWTCTMNGDGAPNGYGVYEIQSNHIANWYYKGTNLDESEQIRIYPIGSFNDNSNYLIANVWNADKNWIISVYEDGVFSGNMTRFTDYEKAMYAFFQTMDKPLPTTSTGTTAWYRRPDHLYRYVPKSSTSVIEVRAKDHFGNEYVQKKFVNDYSTFKSY